MNKFKVAALLFLFFFWGETILGAAWTTRQLTSNSGRSWNPAVAVSGSNIYVVWYDDTTGNFEIYFRKSTDSGATWEVSRRLTRNAGDSYNPAIAVSGSNIYVVWSDNTPGPGNFEIYFRRSADSGATWQASQRLTYITWSSFAPRIAVNKADIYVVWADCAPGNIEIYFRKSMNSGATWQASQRLTNNGGNSKYPAIALSGSNIYMVWCDDTPGNFEIYFRKSTDSGAIWQASRRLTYNSGWSDEPAIAVNGSNMYVVWYDDTLGNNKIYFKKSTDSGTTWQASKRLTYNAGSSYRSVIAVSGTNIYVVWVDDTPGNAEIYFRKSLDSGATWQASQRLTSNAGSSECPAIAVSDSHIYVVWYDDTTGNSEIYLKYSPL